MTPLPESPETETKGTRPCLTTDTQLTVEQCLAELWEMFPKRWITITATTHSARALSIKVSWSISVNQLVDDFEGATLAECMAQVRAWKAQQ